MALPTPLLPEEEPLLPLPPHSPSTLTAAEPELCSTILEKLANMRHEISVDF